MMRWQGVVRLRCALLIVSLMQCAAAVPGAARHRDAATLSPEVETEADAAAEADTADVAAAAEGYLDPNADPAATGVEDVASAAPPASAPAVQPSGGSSQAGRSAYNGADQMSQREYAEAQHMPMPGPAVLATGIAGLLTFNMLTPQFFGGSGGAVERAKC
eukprot:TRINITY_DN25135_c0_g1_i1.p1 TRINITY_DN25135_c0_g1~~TRINITY_DN25135_c0_g1_i1.p1  ORF type:complete len:161 (+),score=42.88 TRINITY_DN25135_c0_g1_i1:177-659(+)